MRRAIEILALSQLLTFFALPCFAADQQRGRHRQVTIEDTKQRVAVSSAAPSNVETWKVSGARTVGRENAIESALAKADERLLTYLRGIRPETNIPQKELRRFVERMRNTKADSYDTVGELSEEEKKELNGKDIYAVELELLLTSPIKEELARKLRHESAKERQWLTTKGLLGVLALLATVGIYYRLDDRTKGYYTNLLRLGALAALGGAGYGIAHLP